MESTRRPTHPYLELSLGTPEEHVNTLDGIVMREKVDTAVLDKLIHSDLLRQDFHCKAAAMMHQNEKKQLQAYRKMVKNGYVEVRYARSHNPSNPCSYGRSNPWRALGLYQIRREIRHTLAEEYYVDLDIENCHPTIARQTCHANGIPCEKLDYYCAHREQILQEYIDAYGCDREGGKKRILACMYGQNFDTFAKTSLDRSKVNAKYLTQVGGSIIPTQFDQEFEAEYNNIRQRIEDANPSLVAMTVAKKAASARAKAGKGDETYSADEYTYTADDFDNVNGSVTSYFLQEREVQILEIMLKYCVENGYVVNADAVLCADGIMTTKEHFRPELLKEMQAEVLAKTGFLLEFSTKAMNKSYLPILDKHLDFDLHKNFSTGVVADWFKMFYGHEYLNTGMQIMQFNGTYWQTVGGKNDEKLQNFVRTTFKEKLLWHTGILVESLNGKVSACTDDANKEKLENERKLAHALYSKIDSLSNAKTRRQFIDDIKNVLIAEVKFDRNPFLFAFTNSIYDLKKGAFVPARPDQYITLTCGYDYSHTYPRSRVATIRQIIEQILPNREVREEYMTYCATGLYGEQIQSFMIATGGGANGKSLLNGLMETAFGDYAYVLPADALTKTIEMGANPQIAQMHCKRFVRYSEPKRSHKLCTATIKAITGDKQLNSRNCHENEVGKRLMLSLVMEGNFLPKLDEVTFADVRRIRVVEFGSRFLDEKNYLDAVALKQTKNLHRANLQYLTDTFKEEHRQAVFEVLLEYWGLFKANNYAFKPLPKECQKRTDAYLAVSDELYDWFSKEFQRIEGFNAGVERPEHVMKIKDVYARFTAGELYTKNTKQYQRDNTQKQFVTRVQENVHMKPFCREARSSYAKKRIEAPFLIGWEPKPAEPEDGGDEDEAEEVEEPTSPFEPDSPTPSPSPAEPISPEPLPSPPPYIPKKRTPTDPL